MNIIATLTGLPPDAVTPAIEHALLLVGFGCFTVGYVLALQVAKAATRRLTAAARA